MITTADLKTQSKTQLGRLAKGLGVSDWQNMRKEDLVALLVKKNRQQVTASKVGVSKKAAPAAAKKSNLSKKVVPAKSVSKKPEAKQVSKGLEKVISSPKSPANKGVNGGKVAKPGKALTEAAKNVAASVPVKSAKQKVSVETSVPKIPAKSTKVAQAVQVKPNSKKPTDTKTVSRKEASQGGKESHRTANKPADLAAGQAVLKAKSQPVIKPVKPKPVAKKQVSTTDVKILEHLKKLHEQRELQKDLAQPALKLADPVLFAEKLPPKPEEKDRVVLIVRDPFWLQASWDVSRRAIDRARASMAEHWHTAKPILRLLTIGGTGTTNAAETVDRDVEIHGGVRNWYIEVKQPPGTFRVLLGYLAANNRFHELSRSNIVTTPAPGSADAVDGNWADIAQDCEHIYALSGGYSTEHESKELQEMFEDRLKRPMGTPALTQFGSGAETAIKRKREFQFDIDAEMILYGVTQLDAYVTLGGEPVKIREDGTFSVRMPLPDKRQVLPAVASSRDGTEQRTIVIAVERNTKVMEPLSKETEE